jgi:hypothetical protein
VHGRAPDAEPDPSNRADEPLTSADGTVWTAYSTVWTTCVLRETDPAGEELRRIVLERERGARVVVFRLLDDGFLLVWQPGDGRDFARVERVGPRGAPVWATVLPRETGDSLGKRVDWRRMRPVRRSAPVVFSGDRVALHFRDSCRSGVAVLYCLNTVTGDFMWVTPTGGGPEAAGPGEFLVHGHTLHLRDRDGAVRPPPSRTYRWDGEST